MDTGTQFTKNIDLWSTHHTTHTDDKIISMEVKHASTKSCRFTCENLNVLFRVPCCPFVWCKLHVISLIQHAYS